MEGESPLGSPPLSREEIIEEGTRLHAQGWSWRRIALHFGRSPETIHRWLDPEYEARVLKRRASYGNKCVVCGKQTDGSRGREESPKYCIEHWREDPQLSPRAKWTKERVIQCIQEWEKEFGEPPTGTDWNPYQARVQGHFDKVERFEERDVPTFGSVIDRFGSWNNAIVAAGFQPRPQHGTPATYAKALKTRAKKPHTGPLHHRNLVWDRETIIAKLRKWNEIHGQNPTSKEWRNSKERDKNGFRIWPDPTTVLRTFGSWNTALRTAGLTPGRLRKRSKNAHYRWKAWEKEEVLVLIREWAETHHGFPPSVSEWRKLPGYPSPQSVKKLFGSWNNAIKEAGFIPLQQGLTRKAIERYLPLPKKGAAHVPDREG